MTTKRINQKKFILSLLPLLYLFIFTPGCIYVLFTFEEDLDQVNQKWNTIDEDDLLNRTVEVTTGPENVTTPLYEIKISDMLHTEHYIADQIVVWNSSGMSQVLFVPQYDDGLDYEVFHSFWIISDYTISNMIDHDITDIKVEWNCSRSISFQMVFMKDTGGVLSDPDLFASSTQNRTGTWDHSWNVIDLLEKQIEVENGRLIFVFTYKQENFTIGDSLSFRIQIEDGEKDPWITQQTILQIGGFGMGGISLIIAMMISPLWNPSPGSKPGIIDKIIVWIQKAWYTIRRPFRRRRG